MVPHLQQGAKMLGKKALQTGVDVAQDLLAGENLKTATKKRAKRALGVHKRLSYVAYNSCLGENRTQHTQHRW